MAHDTKRLIRDPHEWATDNGWVSRRRALNVAAKIDNVAHAIEGAVGDDEGAAVWIRELRRISKEIAPIRTPVERRLSR